MYMGSGRSRSSVCICILLITASVINVAVVNTHEIVLLLFSVVSALRRSEAKVVIGRYSSLVAMATQSFGIPYFITTLMPLDEANTTTSRGMFGLLPGYSDLDQVVLDLLEKYRRTDIAVFVDSHSGNPPHPNPLSKIGRSGNHCDTY